MSDADGRDAADDELSGLEDDLLEDGNATSGIAPATVSGTGIPPKGAIYRIKILHSSETHVIAAEPPVSYAPGDRVVVMTRYGRDIGVVLGAIASPGQEETLKVERMASKEDVEKRNGFAEKELEAFKVCQTRILAHDLPMKLVSSHYLMDEPKILFFFTAESRVDFRELVKDLVSHFKTRIELRQIGVRDEARVLGGIGVCGKVFCCHHVTDKLNAVSIKMAKDQNLSLNSMKISGPCGRLLCCLSYESQIYRDERRGLPSEGVKILHEGTMFRVSEINVLKSLVRLSGEDGRVLKLPARRFKRGEDGRWGVLPEAPLEAPIPGAEEAAPRS
jgi:cell fate regulator YaaT (PSP1 superfamily)